MPVVLSGNQEDLGGELGDPGQEFGDAGQEYGDAGQEYGDVEQEAEEQEEVSDSDATEAHFDKVTAAFYSRRKTVKKSSIDYRGKKYTFLNILGLVSFGALHFFYNLKILAGC